MKEYIEREAAIKTINKLRVGLRTQGAYEFDLVAAEAKHRIESIPAADVVEVVRCRDCLLQRGCKPAQYLGDDGFCSHGERKGGADDADS